MSINEITFFTAIKYSNDPATSFQSALQTVDNYFYLGGKKAHVIKDGSATPNAVVLCDTDSSILARIAKFLTYFTVVIPAAFLLAKVLLRVSLGSSYKFKVISPEERLAEQLRFAEGANVIQESSVQDFVMNRLVEFANISQNETQEHDVVNHVIVKKFTVTKTDDYFDLTLNDGSEANTLGAYKFSFFLNKDAKITAKKANDYFNKILAAKEASLAEIPGAHLVPNAKRYTIQSGDKVVTLIVEERMVS